MAQDRRACSDDRHPSTGTKLSERIRLLPTSDEAKTVEPESGETAAPAEPDVPPQPVAASEAEAVADAGIAPSAEQAADRKGAAVKTTQLIRVNVDTLESLMTMVSELVLTRNQLLEMVRRLDDSEFKVPLQRLSNVTAELQEGVM